MKLHNYLLVVSSQRSIKMETLTQVHIQPPLTHEWSRDGEVDIATRYGPDGPGIESRWGTISAPVQTDSEAHPASYTMGTGSFPG
jgi:hypothetical protein